MAIKKQLQTKTYKLDPEIASRVMLLFRNVVDNGDGTVSVNYSATIHPKEIVYELDENDNQIGIYEERNLQEFEVTNQQLMGLFTIPITLNDGTQTYVGELLSNFADQLIALKYPDPDATITTQHIEISNIISPTEPLVQP